MIILTAQLTFYDGTTYNVGTNNLLSLENSIQDRKDASIPSWGIISNDGLVKIKDYDKTIQNILSDIDFNRDTKVDVYLKNTTSSFETKVGEWLVNKWEYDSESKTASASLYDGLTKMQDINTIPIVKSAKNVVSLTAKQIYENFQDQTVANGFDMLLFNELDDETRTHLSNYTIYLAYVENVTLWNAWKQFCEALQVYIFKNKQGKIVCVYKEGK